MIENRATSEPDVILVGAGIMSATLGVFLKELEPGLNISMVETLDGAALESSDAWNNAGTGHAANCELNYTRSEATAASTFPRRWTSTWSSIYRGSSGPI
jgi:malate dehydrogenase (quinone)